MFLNNGLTGLRPELEKNLLVLEQDIKILL